MFSIINYLVASIFILQPTVQGTRFGNVYQDLTQLIDNSMKENARSSYSRALEEALKKSAHVYYSTDLPLNSISQMTPIFNLLNRAKPHSSQISLILSLRYTDKNRFQWQRLNDAFYNLSLDITQETRTLMKRHLTSVVLDWKVDTCENSKVFFSRANNYQGYGFDPAAVVNIDNAIDDIPYSFPKYARNFLSFYCGESVECSKIAVGVAYKSSQIGCASYLVNQIKHADYLLISTTFSSHRDFPFAYQAFRDYIGSIETQNDFFIGWHWNKPIVYQVDIKGPPTVSQVTLEWKKEWSTLESLLRSSKYYEQTIHEMITDTHEKCMELLPIFMLVYTHIKMGNFPDTEFNIRSYGVILGKTVPLKYSDMSDIPHKDLVIPHLYTNEVEATPCSLKRGLVKTTSDSIIVNTHTWRALARYIKQIVDPYLNCSDHHGNSNLENLTVYSNISMVFSDDIIAMWNDVETYMTQLLKGTKSIGGITVETIIFPEIGITKSVEEFVTSMSSDYLIGCRIHFDKEKLEILQLKAMFSEESRCSSVFQGMCSTIFDQVQTMVWSVDQSSVAKGKELIAVASQVFMKEFPGKSVLLQVTPGPLLASEYISSWSEFYRVPVAI